jgi:transposase-like protein
MNGAASVSIFKRRRCPVEIILLCVRWYCKYGISYRVVLLRFYGERFCSYPASLSN